MVKMTRTSNSSFVKIAVALLFLIQVAHAFVPIGRAVVVSSSSLSAKTPVTGIGGLGGVEIVGLDKKKAASVGSTGKGKVKSAGKKATGGFKISANIFKK